MMLREAPLLQSAALALLPTGLTPVTGLSATGPSALVRPPSVLGLSPLVRLLVVEQAAQQPFPVALVPALVPVAGASVRVPPSAPRSAAPVGRGPPLAPLILALLPEAVLSPPALSLGLLSVPAVALSALALVPLTVPARLVPSSLLTSVFPSFTPLPRAVRLAVVGPVPLVAFLVSMMWHGRCRSPEPVAGSGPPAVPRAAG